MFMKWIKLKSNNLPIVALEIQRAIQIFTSLIDKSDSQNSELGSEATQILEDLNIRIRQLDQYYRQHSLDENISIFHMLKLKLERTVFLAERTSSKVGSQSKKMFEHQTLLQDSDVRWLDQPLFAYYEHSPRKKDTKSSRMSFSQTQQQKSSQKSKLFQKKDDKNKLASKETSSKSNLKTGKSIITSKKQSFNRPPKGEIMKFRPSRVGKPSGVQGIQTPAFGEEIELNPSSMLQSMKKQSELKFTIKMTKEEYKDLLEMKKKMNQSQVS